MSWINSLGNFIGHAGAAIPGAPNLGIGNFLGGNQTAPGALQGVSPYKNIGEVAYAPSSLNGQPNISGAQSSQSQGAPAAAGDTSGGGGGYSGAAAPVNPYLGQAQGLIGQLNDIYNGIYGGIDQSAQSQRANLENQYGNQQTALNDQYTATTKQLPWMFASRGASSSSDNYDAQQLAGKTYQNNIDALSQDKQAKLGLLGTNIAQAKAGYQGQQSLLNNTYAPNLNQYANPYFVSQLAQQLGDATQAAAGYGPQSQFVQGLNAIAPAANTGVNDLQKQLADIAGTSLPQFAKDQLASGFVKSNSQSPQDSNYWINYYKGLTSGSGANA